MDGQNKKNHTNSTTKPHGLRLIKGGSTPPSGRRPNSCANSSANSFSKSLSNPLIKQLSALADALEQDVAQILKL